jgi:hypothetical protein
MLRKSIIFLLLISLWYPAMSQVPVENNEEFRVSYFNRMKSEGSVAYNFFLSSDKEMQELFQTTIMGFGSGFLLDIFATRFSTDMIEVGWEKFNLSLGIGLGINKYRFKNNLVITHSDLTGTIFFEDPDPGHDYVNTFFGYGKSKIVYGSIFFPLHANIKLGDFIISGGPILDLWISGKHKRKFIENDEEKKVKVGNSDFRKYDINKTKTGINFFITHKSGINVGFTYMLTPFFDIQGIPGIHEARISLGYSQALLGKGKTIKSPRDIIREI